MYFFYCTDQHQHFTNEMKIDYYYANSIMFTQLNDLKITYLFVYTAMKIRHNKRITYVFKFQIMYSRKSGITTM